MSQLRKVRLKPLLLDKSMDVCLVNSTYVEEIRIRKPLIGSRYSFQLCVDGKFVLTKAAGPLRWERQQ